MDVRKITPAPALDYDAMMAKRFGTKVNMRGYLERAIVWNLCTHLAARGFVPTVVGNGEDDSEVTDAKSAMELIFDLEEAWVRFKKGDRDHVVYLVMGNAECIVSDWNFSCGDPDGFRAAMDAFDAEAIAPALFTAKTTA